MLYGWLIKIKKGRKFAELTIRVPIELVKKDEKSGIILKSKEVLIGYACALETHGVTEKTPPRLVPKLMKH